MRTRFARFAGMSGAVLAGVLATGAVQSHEVHFTGRAMGINGTVTFASAKKSVRVVDVLMSCSGTAREETFSEVSNPQPLELRARTVHGFTIGRDDVSEASADIEEFHLNLANGLRVDATLVQSEASSTCDPSTFKITKRGSATVGSLFINGEGRPVSGDPNQTFEIPGVGKIVVNEQLHPSSREIIVNAIHVQVADPSYPANGDLVFAHSRAKITCSR